MLKRIQKSSRSSREFRQGKHRHEHWYVSNQVYFITARVRGRRCAFASEAAKAVFWDRWTHYTNKHQFTPFVTALLDNHYHALGYLKKADQFGPMMQRLHGSVAKRVNDLLDERIETFWRDARGREYFDGCIRDETQYRRAFRYTLSQPERHGIVSNYREYPHVRVTVGMERALARARQLGAFMEEIPYKRSGEQRAARGR